MNVLFQDCQQTDTFFSISRCSLQFGNRDSIFSQCSQYQLYEISCANGINYDWTSWAGIPYAKTYPVTAPAAPVAGSYYYGRGSILCFEFGRDIPIDQSEINAPGIVGNFNLSINLTVQNLQNATISSEYDYCRDSNDSRGSTCVEAMAGDLKKTCLPPRFLQKHWPSAAGSGRGRYERDKGPQQGPAGSASGQVSRGESLLRRRLHPPPAPVAVEHPEGQRLQKVLAAAGLGAAASARS